MDFKNIIGAVEKSEEFMDFIKKNKGYYLVHVFTVMDSFNDNVWQIGYYSKDTDKIVVFEYNNDLISIHPPEEALKKEEYIQPLELKALSVSKADAVKSCDKILGEHYSHELLSKAIILLQNLPEYGQVWNITTITQTFNVINIKVDASNGRVVRHEKQNLMSWKS